MKKILPVMIISMLLTACAGKKVVYESADAFQKVSASIETMEVKKNEKTNSTIFHIQTKITNGSDLDLSQVDYQFDCYDRDGNILDTFRFSWYGNDTALLPGTSVTDEKGFQKVLDGEAAKVTVSVTGTKTPEELPLVHLPVTGETMGDALNNEHLRHITEENPVHISIWIDHGGPREIAEISDGKTLKELSDAFAKIRIGNPSETFVTDNYNGVIMEFADGTKTGISLNLTNMELGVNNQWFYYELDNFGPFWQLCNDLAEFPEGE